MTVCVWSLMKPGDWHEVPAEHDPPILTWAPNAPGADDDALNLTPFLITHSGDDSIRRFESALGPFMMLPGGVPGQLQFLTDFTSQAPVTFLGGNLKGRGADRSSEVRVSASLVLQGGGFQDLILVEGTGGEAGIVIQQTGSTPPWLGGVDVNCVISLPAEPAVLNTAATVVNGTIQLGADGASVLFHRGAGRLTIGHKGSVEGFGVLRGDDGGYGTGCGGDLYNHGAITARGDRRKLHMEGSYLFNAHDGVLAATTGATLEIRGSLVGEAGSRAIADKDAVVLVNIAGVSGEMTAEGAGLTFSPHADNAMTGLLLHGAFRLDTGGYVTASDTTLDGTATLEAPSAQLKITGMIVDGRGGPGSVVHGCGAIVGSSNGQSGTLENRGTIRADRRGETLDVFIRTSMQDRGLVNRGTLTADPGATLKLGGVLVGEDASRIVAPERGGVLADILEVRGVTATEGYGLAFSPHSDNGLAGATINGPIDLRSDGRVTADGATLNGFATLAGETTQTMMTVTAMTLGEPGGIRGFGVVGPWNSPQNCLIENRGAIMADTPGRTLTVDVTVKNRAGGVLDVVDGATLYVGDNRGDTVDPFNSGLVDIHAGGTMDLVRGWGRTLQVDGETRVDGTLNVIADALEIRGGSLTGTGAINGTVVLGPRAQLSYRARAGGRIRSSDSSKVGGLTISDGLVLDGELFIVIGPQPPAEGELLVVLRHRPGQRHGTFAQTSCSDPDYVFAPVYADDMVALRVESAPVDRGPRKPLVVESDPAERDESDA